MDGEGLTIARNLRCGKSVKGKTSVLLLEKVPEWADEV